MRWSLSDPQLWSVIILRCTTYRRYRWHVPVQTIRSRLMGLAPVCRKQLHLHCDKWRKMFWTIIIPQVLVQRRLVMRRHFSSPLPCNPSWWILLPCSLPLLQWSLSVKEPSTSQGSSFARRIPVPPVDLQLELPRVPQLKLTVVVVSLKKYAAQVIHFVLIVTMKYVVRRVSLSTWSFSFFLFRLLVNAASLHCSDVDCTTQFFAAPQVSI